MAVMCRCLWLLVLATAAFVMPTAHAMNGRRRDSRNGKGKGLDEIRAEWLRGKGKLNSNRLTQTILRRAKWTQFRAKQLMVRPFPPGMGKLGRGYNAFWGEEMTSLMFINSDLIHDGTRSPLYKKFSVPVCVAGDLISREGDGLSTNFYREENGLRQNKCNKNGITNYAGMYAFSNVVDTYRPTFVNQNYVVELTKTIRAYDLEINLGVSHAEEDLNNDATRRDRGQEDDYDGDHRPALKNSKNFEISSYFKNAVCIKGATALSLPDCVFNPKSLLFDKDVSEEAVEALFGSRNPKEEEFALKEGDEVRACNAADTLRMAAFYNTFGTHVTTKVSVGGQARESFVVRGSVVDNEPTRPGQFIDSMINKYNEHEGAHKNVGGRYDLQMPLLEEESNAFLSKKMQAKPFTGALTAEKWETKDTNEDLQDAPNAVKREQKRRTRQLLMDEKSIRQSTKNGLFAPPVKKDVQSFVESLGIQKVTMEYIGGGRFPMDGTNLADDDYSVWEDSIDASPDVISSRLDPIGRLLNSEQVLTTCKVTKADGCKNPKSCYETAAGRSFIRKKLAMSNFNKYFRMKADAYAEKKKDQDYCLLRTNKHLRTSKVALADFGKAILRIDPTANLKAVKYMGTMSLWNQYLSKSINTNPKGLSLLAELIAPVVSYNTQVYQSRKWAARYCATTADIYSRVMRFMGYVGGMGNVRTSASAEDVQNTTDDSNGDITLSVPTLEEHDPAHERRSKNEEQLCVAGWKQKLVFHEKNNYGENTEFGSIVKRIFYDARDLSCAQCVSVAANELNPQREFTLSKEIGEEGIQSSVMAYCYSLPSKLLQTSCKLTARSLRDVLGNEKFVQPHEVLNPKRQLSWFITKMMKSVPQFQYKLDQLQREPTKKTFHSIANKVCGLYQGCPFLPYGDHAAHNDDNEAAAAVQANKDEGKTEKQLMNEVDKLKQERGKEKIVAEKRVQSLKEKFVTSEKSKTCSDFRVMYQKYKRMKAKARASKNIKRCFVCSRFTLLNRMAVDEKSTVLSGENRNLYPAQYEKYPDFSKEVCSGAMFAKKSTDSLAEAVKKCPNGFEKFTRKQGAKTLKFIELVAGANLKLSHANPITDLLGGEGTSKQTTENSDPGGLKTMSKELGKNVLDCGIGKLTVADRPKLQEHLDCLVKTTNNVFDFSMTVGECKAELISVQARLTHKLRNLAAAMGRPMPENMPFPKKLELYEVLRDQAIDSNGEMSSSVIDGEALGAADKLTFNSVCHDLKVGCSIENADKMRTYFTKQAQTNWAHNKLLSAKDLESPITNDYSGIPLVRPGFGKPSVLDIQRNSKISKKTVNMKKGKAMAGIRKGKPVAKGSGKASTVGSGMKFKAVSAVPAVSDASSIIKELESMERSISPVIN